MKKYYISFLNYSQGFYKTNVYSDGLNEDTFGSTLISQLNETKEKNKALRIEVEDLKQKLIDAQGDIKVN